MSTVRLTITGMHCANCQTKVEQALKAVPGTFGVSVDLQGGSAEVDFDPGRAAAERYADAVRSVGYQARVAA